MPSIVVPTSNQAFGLFCKPASLCGNTPNSNSPAALPILDWNTSHDRLDHHCHQKLPLGHSPCVLQGLISQRGNVHTQQGLDSRSVEGHQGHQVG